MVLLLVGSASREAFSDASLRAARGGSSGEVSPFRMAVPNPRAWIREFDEKHPGIARQIQEAREQSKQIAVEPYALPSLTLKCVEIDNGAAPAKPPR